MRVNFQIAIAFELQIHRCMFGKQREHVIKKGDAGFDFGFAAAIEIEADGNIGLPGVARNGCLPDFHAGIKSNRPAKNKAQLRYSVTGVPLVCFCRGAAGAAVVQDGGAH